MTTTLDNHDPWKPVALIGSSGGGTATLGHTDAVELLQTINKDLHKCKAYLHTRWQCGWFCRHNIFYKRFLVSTSSAGTDQGLTQLDDVDDPSVRKFSRGAVAAATNC